MIKLPTTFVQKANQVGLVLGKHSPLILTSVGIIGLGATAYLSYKSAGKVERITVDLETRRESEEEARAARFEYESTDYGSYFEEQREALKRVEELEGMYTPINRLEVTRDLAGAIALPVVTGVASIACIFYSYRILTNRNAVLATTLGTVLAEHKYYKERVRQEVGDDVANKINTPTETKTVTRENKKGNLEEIDETTQTFRRTMTGEWFNLSSEYCRDDHSYNMAYIDSQSAMLDLKLFRKGFLRLNEVNDALGLPRTKNGELMGWTSGMGCNIDTQITNINDDEGFARPEIYVKWTQPTYIYDSVNYGEEYAVGL